MRTILSMIAHASVLLIVMAALNGSANACSCVEERTVDREFASSKTVALLKAVAYPANVHEKFAPDQGIGGFKFEVLKVFKGSSLKAGKVMDIFAGGSGCQDFSFQAGDLGSEYLFYYFSDEMIGIVPWCSRSGKVEWRSGDLLYLENIDSVRGLTRISGRVTQSFRSAIEGQSGKNAPLAGHTVRITGGGRDLRIKTDENGVYQVYGLLPGQYRIEPAALKGFVATDAIRTRTERINVGLLGRSHIETDFHFEIYNAIRGKLIGDDGMPLPKLRLNLVPATGTPAKFFVETAYPEKDGSFAFERIPAGKYVIVGNPENVLTADYPYPRFYSSGADDRATAQVITIGPGEFLDGFVIRASKPADTVIISGKLLFDDGTPVKGGSVEFRTAVRESRAPDDPIAYAKGDGSFELKILKGQKGVISGYIYPGTWAYSNCADKGKSSTQGASRSREETNRIDIESATEATGLELRFPFIVCAGK